MGGCSSKVTPVYSLPPHTNTSSRSISYDYNDVVGHVYKRDKLASAMKSEFDTYKRNLRSIEVAIKSGTHVLFTEFFYDRQGLIKVRLLKLFDEMKKYDIAYVKTYKDRFEEFEESYQGYILYLYNADKLTIDDALLKREEVRSFFGIRKKLVSFSEKSTIFVIPSHSED